MFPTRLIEQSEDPVLQTQNPPRPIPIRPRIEQYFSIPIEILAPPTRLDSFRNVGQSCLRHIHRWLFLPINEPQGAQHHIRPPRLDNPARKYQ